MHPRSIDLQDITTDATAQRLIMEDLQLLADASEKKLPLGKEATPEQIDTLVSACRLFSGDRKLNVKVLSVNSFVSAMMTAGWPAVNKRAAGEGLWAMVAAMPLHILTEEDIDSDTAAKASNLLRGMGHLNGSQLVAHIEECIEMRIMEYNLNNARIDPARLLHCEEMLEDIVDQQIRLRTRKGKLAERRATAGREVIHFLGTHPCLGVTPRRRGQPRHIVFASR